MTEKGTKASLNSNSLLAYKLLSDAWDKDPGNNVFAQLMKDELKTLATSISLLQSDPVLAMHYGGVNLNAAEKMSDVLKAKVGELDVKGRLEPTAQALLLNKYTAESQQALMPGKLDAVTLGEDGALQIGVKSPAGVNIARDDVNNPFNLIRNYIDGGNSNVGISNSSQNKSKLGKNKSSLEQE